MATLEALLERLITVTEANTAARLAEKTGTATAGGTVVDMPVKPKKAAASTAAAAITFDQVKVAMAAARAKLGLPFCKKLIETTGKSKELATVKPENYAVLIAAAEKAIEGGEAEEEDDEEEM